MDRNQRLQEIFDQQKALDEQQARLKLNLDLFAKHFGSYKVGDVAKNFNGEHEFRVEKIHVRSNGWGTKDSIQITYSGPRRTKAGFHRNAHDQTWEWIKLEKAA